MTAWYERVFANLAAQYDAEPYTQGTQGECDFIDAELGHDRGRRILDIGCGTGRHAIELAARGYAVTGIDLSEAQLRRAREKAAARGVTVDFARHDARALPYAGEFDAAIMLCEGAFPLMATDDENYEILRGAPRALVPGGVLIMTTLNGLFPLYHSLDHMDGTPGPNPGFDLMTMRNRGAMTMTDDGGADFTVEADERYYLPSEVRWLLRSLGFGTVDIYGATIGAYSRTDALTTSDVEMLVISRRDGAETADVD